MQCTVFSGDDHGMPSGNGIPRWNGNETPTSHRHTRHDTGAMVLSCLVWRRELEITTGMGGGSVAEWLASWTQALKGPGSNHSCDTVS